MKSYMVLAAGLALAVCQAGSGSHALQENGRQPTGDDNRRILRQDGFKQWGCSSVFARGPFTVEAPISGGVTLYKDVFEGVRDLTKTTGIHFGPLAPSQPSVLGILTNGVFRHDSLDGASGSGDAPVAMNTRLPIADQLQRSGFREDPKGCGVYRRTIAGVSVLALIENGKLHRLVRPVTHPLLEGASLRPGYQEIKSAGKAPEGVLKFAGPGIRFSFSSAHYGHVPGDSIELFGDLKKTRHPSLRVTPFAPEKDKNSAFMVGGKNTTETIRALKSINGQTIAALEARMRPGKDSSVGFLGKNEKLLDVMATDNDFVVGKMGLTHQAIAEPMHLVRRLAETGLYSGKNIVYNGQRLRIQATFTRGTQPSPFNDGTNHGANVVVTNLDRGTSVSFGLLLPDMIERYGFYEGRGTSYRVEPASVARVFGLDTR